MAAVASERSFLSTRRAQALTAGYGRALLAGSIALLAATVIALRATNAQGNASQPDPEPTPGAAGRPVPVAAE